MILLLLVYTIHPEAAGTSLSENRAQQLALIPSGMETGLAETVIKDVICNRWE